jgi:Fungal Zn(2)-Cys(6) binuclear cluster domain
MSESPSQRLPDEFPSSLFKTVKSTRSRSHRGKRPRPVLSCSECRQRKLGCDRRVPCNQCVKAKRGHQCVYPNGTVPKTNTHSATLVSTATTNNTQHNEDGVAIASPRSLSQFVSPSPTTHTSYTPNDQLQRTGSPESEVSQRNSRSGTLLSR